MTARLPVFEGQQRVGWELELFFTTGFVLGSSGCLLGERPTQVWCERSQKTNKQNQTNTNAKTSSVCTTSLDGCAALLTFVTFGCRHAFCEEEHRISVFFPFL